MHPEIYGGFASMSAVPLVIVPAFFVPAFSLIHLAAWFAARRQPLAGALEAAGRT